MQLEHICIFPGIVMDHPELLGILELDNHGVDPLIDP
jgi:hypothetical protein